MNENELFTVYSRKLAYRLRMFGCEIVKTVPNPQKPEFDAYVFVKDKKFDWAWKVVHRDNISL